MKKRLVAASLLLVFLYGCSDDERAQNEHHDNDVQMENEMDETRREEHPLDGMVNEEGNKGEEAEEDEKKEEIIDETMEEETYDEVANIVMEAIKDKNMEALADRTHSSLGLLFSPYGYINEQKAKVFTKEEVAHLHSDNTVYEWGEYDGTGDPIKLTFSDYYDRFIYDVDFADAPEMSVNERLGYGNTIDNSREVFPDSVIIEYHYPEIDPQYEGMDWRSLRIILLEEENKWYVVAIVHDEWTI